MNAVNDMLNLIKGRTQKYTHKKRVHSASKGKMVWRYFYKEHHGKGATHVDDLKVGEAFKVNYEGNEGHFHIKKIKDGKITVIHDETKEEKTLTKRELRAVLLSTHAEALKANVKKKEARYKNAKSKKAKKNAKRRLEQARKKATPRKQMVQTAENVQDNFETMPEPTPAIKQKKHTRTKNYIRRAKDLEQTPLYFIGAEGLTEEFTELEKEKAKEIGGKHHRKSGSFYFKQEIEALEFANYVETNLQRNATEIENAISSHLRESYPEDFFGEKHRIYTGMDYAPTATVKHWRKHGKNRIYFELEQLTSRRAKPKAKGFIEIEPDGIKNHISFVDQYGTRHSRDFHEEETGKLEALFKELETKYKKEPLDNFDSMPEMMTNEEGELVPRPKELIPEPSLQEKPATFTPPKTDEETAQRAEAIAEYLKSKYDIDIKNIRVSEWGNITFKMDSPASSSKLINLVQEKHKGAEAFHEMEYSADLVTYTEDFIKILETLERDQAQTSQAPKTEQEPTPAPTDARQDLVQQAEQVIQETHDKHDDKPLERKPLNDFEIGEHVHTRTGETAHTVKSKKRVARDKFFEQKRVAKRLDGFYSKFTKKWHFTDKDKALEFAHHFEPEATEPAPTPTDAKHEHLEHHTDNFETMPEVESQDSFKIIKNEAQFNNLPFTVVMKNSNIDHLILSRLAVRKYKGRSTYTPAEKVMEAGEFGFNFETKAQAESFIKDIKKEWIEDNRQIDKRVDDEKYREAQKKIPHETLENLGDLQTGDYTNILEDADKKKRDRKHYNQTDFDLKIKITKHERKKDHYLDYNSPATRRRKKGQVGINGVAYDTRSFHELEVTIDKKHLPLINQKVSPSKDPLKLRFEVRENKKTFNSGKTVIGINIVEENLFRYEGKKTSKHFDHIEIDPVTLEVKHNWTIQGFRQENEIKELKDFLDTEINKLLDLAMPNPKRLDAIRNKLAKEAIKQVEDKGYKYDTNSKPLSEHFEQKTRAYTNRSKEGSTRTKSLLKRNAKPMIWDKAKGDMVEAPAPTARDQMVQTAENVQDNFETMPEVETPAPERSNKETLELYKPTEEDLGLSGKIYYEELTSSRSLTGHINIHDTIENKLSMLDRGKLPYYTGRNIKSFQALDKELNDIELLVKPLIDIRFTEKKTGRYAERIHLLDKNISDRAENYDDIAEVRWDAEFGDLKEELRKEAEELYSRKQKQFKAQLDIAPLKSNFKATLEEGTRQNEHTNHMKLHQLKKKLPPQVHNALEERTKKGNEKHKKDIQEMIAHYNTQADKIAKKAKSKYKTAGDIYNTIKSKEGQVTQRGSWSEHHFSFNAKVQGRSHKKLIAKMFNEIMEQVAQEKANEPAGLVESAPAPQPMNARDQMVQTAENVQDNFETMPEVDYESLNRGQKIKIDGNVYTIGKKRDRSFNSVGHGIQLNDENGKLSGETGLLIFNDNGKVTFKDTRGSKNVKDLKEAQLITGNKEQSIKFKNDPREPLPKPTGGIISNMSRRREAQKQTRQPRQPRQPRKKVPQTISTDQTDSLKGTFWEEYIQPEIKKYLSETVSAGKDASQLNNHTAGLYDLKQAVQDTDKLKLVNIWNRGTGRAHQQIVDFAKTGNLEPLKKLLADFRTDYLSIIANNSLHNGFAKRAKIAIRDSKTSEVRELANQEYLDFEKQYLDRAKQIFKENRTETDAQVIQFIKEEYFKGADKLTPSEKTTITKRFDDAISKYSKPANARDQMVQTAENVQDNFETMPETTHKKILKDVVDSANDKLLEMVLDYKSMLQIFGKRDEHAQQVANEKVMTILANKALKSHLKAGNYDKATIDQLSNLDIDSPQMQELIDTLHNRALETQTQKREQATKTTPQEPQNLQHTQADLNAISTREFERAYYNQSHSSEARGRSKRKEYVNTLNEFEALAQELIELGADKAKVQQLAQQSAERYTNALKDELSSEAKTASWAVVGPAGFNTRRQEKLRGYADNKRSKTIQAKNQAIKNFEKLRLSDPNSARATQEQRTQEALKEIADRKKRAEDTRAKAKAEKVTLPTNTPLQMTKQNFHSLKSGDRIKLTYKIDRETKTEELQVGRESYSKRNFTTTKKLHPVINGKADKTIDVSIYSMENHPNLSDMLRLSDGRARWGNTEMQSFELLPSKKAKKKRGMKKAYKRASARDLLLKALIA